MVIKVVLSITIPDWLTSPFVWLVLSYRKLHCGYAFRKIPLTQGKYAIVDPEDYEELSKYKWFAIRSKRGFYAARSVGTNRHGAKQKTVRMHQVILKPPAGKFVDHINHNGLDNRKSNLRICTMQQNSWNMRKHRGNCSSKYKGVTWHKSEGKWQTRITCNGKSFSIGYFDDEKAAAMAYDKKAKGLFGEYGSLNFKC